MKRACLITLLLLVLAGCDNEDIGSSFVPPGEISDYFPLAVGNWWKYSGVELDSLGNPVPNTEYTTFSTITGDSLIAGTPYYVMTDSSDTSSTSTWINCWRIVEDTLKLRIMFGPFFWSGNYFIMPQPLRTTWTVVSLDTSYSLGGISFATTHLTVNFAGEIFDFGSYAVPAGNLGSVCHVLYTIIETVEIFMIDEPQVFTMEMEVWYAKNVGIIRQYYLPMTGAGNNAHGRLEELIEYHLE